MVISEYVAFPDMLPVFDEFLRKRALSCIVFTLRHGSLFLSFFLVFSYFFFYVIHFMQYEFLRTNSLC
jgi:hypothetical protein